MICKFLLMTIYSKTKFCLKVESQLKLFCEYICIACFMLFKHPILQIIVYFRVFFIIQGCSGKSLQRIVIHVCPLFCLMTPKHDFSSCLKPNHFICWIPAGLKQYLGKNLHCLLLSVINNSFYLFSFFMPRDRNTNKVRVRNL